MLRSPLYNAEDGKTLEIPQGNGAALNEKLSSPWQKGERSSSESAVEALVRAGTKE